MSDKHEEIKKLLMEDLNKSITLYKARGGKEIIDNTQYEVIYTIVTRLEVNRVIRKVIEIDPKAFIAEHIMGDVHGGVVKKKSFFES